MSTIFSDQQMQPVRSDGNPDWTLEFRGLPDAILSRAIPISRKRAHVPSGNHNRPDPIVVIFRHICGEPIGAHSYSLCVTELCVGAINVIHVASCARTGEGGDCSGRNVDVANRTTACVSHQQAETVWRPRHPNRNVEFRRRPRSIHVACYLRLGASKEGHSVGGPSNIEGPRRARHALTDRITRRIQVGTARCDAGLVVPRGALGVALGRTHLDALDHVVVVVSSIQGLAVQAKLQTSHQVHTGRCPRPYHIASRIQTPYNRRHHTRPQIHNTNSPSVSHHHPAAITSRIKSNCSRTCEQCRCPRPVYVACTSSRNRRHRTRGDDDGSHPVTSMVCHDGHRTTGRYRDAPRLVKPCIFPNAIISAIGTQL
mmetsp:Transcript_35201/g.88931  ORF Transcript_35201/g.88931 Transcript_35201/m.88931 type:complete len:371 (-) Transcript_35201:858-1970(-)